MSEETYLFPHHIKELSAKMMMESDETARNMVVALKRKVRLNKIMQDLTLHVSGPSPFHVLNLLEKESSFLKEECSPSQAKALERLKQGAQRVAKKHWLRYSGYLEAFCEEEDVPLDQTSRHPNYTFAHGFFDLTIRQDGIAILSNSERKLAQFPADIEVVVAKVKKEHRRVWGRQFHGEKFLKKLRKHYLQSLERDKHLDGSNVPIRRIAGRVTSERKKYRTDEFLVDLSKLVREGPCEMDGRRLVLQHTRDTKQGMLLHDVDTAGYIGYLSFQEVKA
jgi:hypothetical protein